MRRITLGETGIETSALGFGGSSLGSRVDAAEGARALQEALDAGVTWVDLAPVYGAGRAEEIVGSVLRGRRESAQICTKVGLRLAGGVGGRLRTALMPVARRILGRNGPLQGALRRAAPKANAPLRLTPELLRTSIEESLRRLGTDRVEVYALHAVAPEEIRREEIQRALEDIVASGKARAVAVASEAAAAAAALETGPPFGVLQMAILPLGQPNVVLPQAQAQGMGCITHSILGSTLAKLVHRAEDDADFRARVCAAADLGNPEAALARLLMDRAFALNPDGVVLVSMLSPRSLARNVAAASELKPGGLERAASLETPVMI